MAVALALIGAFAIVTGCGDVAAGPQMMRLAGARLGPAALDPVVDSQTRFLGAIWAGWGASLIWASRDPIGRRGALRLLGATMMLAGFGRAIGLVAIASASPLLGLLALLEITGPLVIAVLLATARAEIGSSERRDGTDRAQPG